MRILHTADWHLGHQLHGFDRGPEHERFLGWLLDQVRHEKPDALLIAGDIFDTANPSAAAQTLFYRWLTEAVSVHKGMAVALIAGNHDSAARLDAVEPVLSAIGVSVVGTLPRDPAGALDVERLIVPLGPEAVALAVPFLRPSDLPRIDGGDALVEGVRAVYAEVIEAARDRHPGKALIGLGHCYMVGGALSELSERRVLGGNQHALPVDLFPADLAYVALGHLHRAQQVGGRSSVRYAGSPIPLSMTEADYVHQVMLAEVGASITLRPLRVPRSVELLRLPTSGPAPVEAVLAAIRALPAAQGPEGAYPYVEVQVLLTAPRPGLRQEIEKALEGKAARLATIRTHRVGTGEALAEADLGKDLRDLQPEEVFLRRWRRDHEGDPPAPLLAAFYALLSEAGGAA